MEWIVKSVKDKTAWNFPKKAAVLINSYGLAPPDPPVPSLIRSILDSPISPQRLGRQASLAAQSFPSPKIAARDFFCLPFVLAGLSKLQNLRVFISACWLSSSIKQSLCQISPCGYYCFLISEIGHFSAFIRVFVAHRGGTGVPFSASFVTHIDSRAKKGDEGLELFPENGSLYKCDGLEPPIPQYPHRSVVFYPGPLPPKRPGWQASPAASRSLPPRIAAGDFFAWKKVARYGYRVAKTFQNPQCFVNTACLQAIGHFPEAQGVSRPAATEAGFETRDSSLAPIRCCYLQPFPQFLPGVIAAGTVGGGK